MSDPAFPLEPFGSPTNIRLRSTALAVIRHQQVRLPDLPALFDVDYGTVATLFADGRLEPAGPAVAVYRGDPAVSFDIEIGFPVRSALDGPVGVGDAEVVPSTLPEGPALAVTHYGSYETLGSAWEALTMATAEGPVGIWVESYVSDPAEPPAALRTDLIMPLQG